MLRVVQCSGLKQVHGTINAGRPLTQRSNPNHLRPPPPPTPRHDSRTTPPGPSPGALNNSASTARPRASNPLLGPSAITTAGSPKAAAVTNTLRRVPVDTCSKRLSRCGSSPRS
ncbi:hypothetical protein G6F68_015029 [Rhizopus microsporus]|nr:hypothetical protein G6F68_015029 [Rhizopus microsporus]